LPQSNQYVAKLNKNSELYSTISYTNKRYLFSVLCNILSPFLSLLFAIGTEEGI